MLERLLGFSIRHRVMMVLATVALAVIGGYSLTQLPIDAVPDITNQQVQINTLSPGLSPTDAEKQVTFPIETALAGIRGLDYTRSLSRNGFSQVTAVFHDEVDIYFARQQVNERLLEARENIPPGTEPKMGPIATGLGEIYMWTVEYVHPSGRDAEVKDSAAGWQRDGSYLTPEGQSLRHPFEQAAYLRTVQDWIVRPQVKTVAGVAGVDAIGGYVKQYHVQPEPSRLLAYDLTFEDLIAALERNNASVGAGYIETQGEALQVRSDGRIANVAQIADIVVATRDGTPIHVHDVADVGIGKELRTGAASENGEEVVVGTALMRIGENSRAVAAAVDEKLKAIGKSLPPDVRLKPVLNRTLLVDATIKTVRNNLLEGAALVIAVLFWILGNLRAALITALMIPLAMLMTATGMVRGGLSGNLMSLGALDFGLIVDGAVIIVENCLRHLAERQRALGRRLTLDERLQEVAISAKQVIQPSVFGQAIIITVYLPILSLTGIEGKMFHPMAATVILALLSAFVLSLTFVPAMVALVFRGDVEEKDSRFMQAVKTAYEPLLATGLRQPGRVVAVAAIVFVSALWLFTRLGQEFVPTLDEKNLAVQSMRIPSTSLSQSQTMQMEVEKTAARFPEVAYVFGKTGTAEMATDPMPPNASDTFVMLKPHEEWPDPGKAKAELVEQMEQALEQLPGNQYEFTQPIQMRFNELIAGVRSDVAVKLFGDDFDVMQPLAQRIGRLLQDVPGAADVKVEQTSGLPMLNVVVDRTAIARYGLNVADVQDVIAVAVGGRPAGLVFEGDRRFALVIRLPETLRGDVAALRQLPIPLPQSTAAGPGQPRYLPLSEVARIEIAEGPNQVSRENGKRRIVVQANVRGRDLGSFVTEAEQRLEAELKLPAGYWLDWGGQFENLVKAKARLQLVVPVCFFLIFMLLFSAFNSVKQALLIFTGVPFALIGGVLALWLRGMPFSITAAVGFIALSGVAVLNGLVMVSFIDQLRREGLPLEQAITQGAITRLRPVLMTALVASLGFVPMALATGTGAEVQKPLATVVIGGLISSTVLTLWVLPLLYRLFEFGRPSGPEPPRPACCGGTCHGEKPPAETTIPSTPTAASEALRFKIEGMDCAEEIAVLKRELGPLVGGEDRLAFNLLDGTMSLSREARLVAADVILRAVARAGMRAALLSGPKPSSDESFWKRHGRTVLTAVSGLLTLAGFLTHAVLAGGITDALGSEGAGLVHDVPPVAKSLYALGVLAGAWYILPKAWFALQRLSPDMNLLMTVAVSGAVGIGEWFEASTVAFLFALSHLLESWSVGRARRAIAALMGLAPPIARLKREDGREVDVAPETVPVGALFVVKPGERIPLDGTVRAGVSGVNQAPITGESVPVPKEPGGEVFAGTINGDGALEVECTKPAGDTTLAHIIRLVGEAQSKRAPSEQWVERFARIYTPSVMGLAVAVLLIPPLLFGAPWMEWLYRALVLLVIACPCALVISTPVSIVAALAAAARNGVLVKGGLYIEAPAHLKAIAFDKTGTLTEGRMKVVEVVPLSGHDETGLLERVAALEARSDHPLARAIVAYTEEHGVTIRPAEEMQILQGKGATGRFNGKSYWIGSHRYLEERGQETEEIHRQLENLSQAGRTVVVVGNETHVCGFIALADTVRLESAETVKALRKAGVEHLIMLTGDNAGTAQRIARETGVDEVRAELLPADKVAAVETLVANYGQVAMVGDGVNDAPAMARASLGIAMGAVGSDAAIETADIALMSDDLTKLPWLIRHSRRTLAVIRQNIGFSLLVKAAFVALTFLGSASLWAAIAADMGASLLVIFNGLRLLKTSR
jgi:cobalt-zinc-cadmium resistance protein CzcA